MLIDCAAYLDGARLSAITIEEISDYLAKPGVFVWVALLDPESGELDKMQEEFGLHDLAVEDAQRGHQRPKIEEYGDSLFAVLHTIETDHHHDGPGELHQGELSIFAGRNYLLTVRRGCQRGFADVRERCEREPQLLANGAGFAFYALMDEVVDRYLPVIDDLEEEFERLEAAILSHQAGRPTLAAVYELKQRLMVLRHAVTSLEDAVSSKLVGGRVPRVTAAPQEYFRDVLDHLYRVSHAIDSLRDMIDTALQVNLTLITLAESEVTKRLAAWGAIIAVPTLIAGIYGMNFKFMPEIQMQIGYPLSLVSMLAVDIWLYFRFRKFGWL